MKPPKITVRFCEENPWTKGRDYDFSVSFSKDRRFHICPRAFYHEYILKTEARRSSVLWRGRLEHVFHHDYGEHCAKLGVSSDPEAWAELLLPIFVRFPKAGIDLQRIVKKNTHHFVSQYEFLLSEHEEQRLEQMVWVLIEYPGEPGLIVNGRIDRSRIDRKAGVSRAVDYKTGKQVMKTEKFEADIQSITYAWFHSLWCAEHIPNVKWHQAEFVWTNCGCEAKLKDNITEEQFAELLDYYHVTVLQMRRLYAEIEWWQTTPESERLPFQSVCPASPGVGCYEGEEPCPFIWACKARINADVPVVETVEQAQQVLGDYSYQSALNRERRKLVLLFQDHYGQPIEAGGKVAGPSPKRVLSVTPDADGDPDIDSVARYLQEHGQKLCTTLTVNGKKRAAVDALLAVGNLEGRAELERLAREGDDLEKSMAEDKLREHPVLLTESIVMHPDITNAGARKKAREEDK